MSKSDTVQFIENGMSKTLGTSARSIMGGGYYNDYTLMEPELRRHACVTAALELIKAEVSNTDKSDLSYQMSRLDQYADIIQSALENTK